MINREAQKMEKAVYDTKVALAVANAVYRKNGYVRTTEADYNERKSNKTLVIEELAKLDPQYSKKDVNVAEEIIEHYQGLLLFKLGDTNNGFQEAVLACIAQDTIKARDIGILASLPHTYKTTLDKEARKAKEEAMASKSDFVGDVKKRNVFDVVVEMVKPLPHKGLFIVSFMQARTFSNIYTRILKMMELLKVLVCRLVHTSKIKVNKYNGGKETIVNRIKVRD